jgi:fluoroquinolone transport system ATP-binding protein
MIHGDALRFTYPHGAEPAVREITFDVRAGEVFGFLGPNGAGKSTTQKILIGLLRGFEGTVHVLGRPIGDWGSDLYERIGVSFELPNHYLRLTGRENLRYFRALYEGDTEDPDALLRTVGLAGEGDVPVAHYSKGMKVRLGLARALLNRPRVLVLDEPTAGLDPVGGRGIRELIRGQRALGRTVFLTTHDMTVANDLCDRVAFLVEGRIAVVDTPRDLRLRFGQRRVRVEVDEGGTVSEVEFPMEGLGHDRAFLQAVRSPGLQTIHTLEASLDDIFVQVTGRSLS